MSTFMRCDRCGTDVGYDPEAAPRRGDWALLTRPGLDVADYRNPVPGKERLKAALLESIVRDDPDLLRELQELVEEKATSERA